MESERLLKDIAIPASELTKQKKEALDRAEAFTEGGIDEEFVDRTEKLVSPSCPTPIGQRIGIVAGEAYEE